MGFLNFTVDAALLRELGERLVGKPFTALAELIKNGYDADATQVTLSVDQAADTITVTDNGHGMTLQDFRNFWMRVGSPHKLETRLSPGLHRQMTGSKGVGRLAVQFLAHELELVTQAKGSPGLRARVDWKKAWKAKSLTTAKVEYSETPQRPSKPGTTLTLRRLQQPWTPEDIRSLAEETWWLQPPFRGSGSGASRFQIDFRSSREDLEQAFTHQTRAILDIWHARIVGKSSHGKLDVSLEFAGQEPIHYPFVIPECQLVASDFEILVYHLTHRQQHRIKVGEAREYLKKFGGVHVYDRGFHLPFYGTPENDWLKIQWEQAQRLSKSDLLPAELQIADGLNFIPTASRLLGVVNVDTGREPKLQISITRDRLQDSPAFTHLAEMVRTAVHFYAVQEARRTAREAIATARIETPSRRAARITEVLDKYRDDLPAPAFLGLERDLYAAIQSVDSDADALMRKVGMLGALATAGISALAFHHELQKQLASTQRFAERLREVATTLRPEVAQLLGQLATDFDAWADRARATNNLFGYLADADNSEVRLRLKAKVAITEITSQVSTLARGAEVLVEVPDALLLPMASYAEWGAIFQNVLINAFGALLSAENKIVRVTAHQSGSKRELRFEDTGSGVELADWKSLFEPFVRRRKLSDDDKALGYGGTGLGLTIVRLVANNIGCEVGFSVPSEGFRTCFYLGWEETK